MCKLKAVMLLQFHRFTYDLRHVNDYFTFTLSAHYLRTSNASLLSIAIKYVIIYLNTYITAIKN